MRVRLSHPGKLISPFSPEMAATVAAAGATKMSSRSGRRDWSGTQMTVCIVYC